MTAFEAAVIFRDGVAVVTMAGRLDGDADESLRDAGATAISMPGDRIELDFGGVGYINSTGIALLVTLLADARRTGRSVVARGLSEHFQHIFEITRLSDFVHIEAVRAQGEASSEPAGGR